MIEAVKHGADLLCTGSDLYIVLENGDLAFQVVAVVAL
jgi:hypothetical protein